MKNSVLQIILILALIAIDVWFFQTYTSGSRTDAGMLALLMALASHFSVAGYYYHKAQKAIDDRPYTTYAFLGFVVPYLSIIFVDVFKGKARTIIDNIMFWSSAIIVAALLLAVIISYII